MNRFSDFEEIVEHLPAEVLMTDDERAELIILARSADREARSAEVGEGHELGSTMARFLVRFTEVVGAGDPAFAARITGELRATVARSDAAALDEHRRGLE